MYDLLITGGRILDGTGTPWYYADVAVAGDRIVEIGRLGRVQAHRNIKADGCFVSPGFIDLHTHSDLHPLANPLQEPKLRQGVTTEVIGQDGLGLAPLTPSAALVLREQLAAWNGTPDVAWDWSTITTYLDRFDNRVAVNVAMLVPHGTLRLLVMGMEDRAPSGDEMARMRRMVDQAMREGTVGLSTGLTYAPAMYADDDELVDLCRMLAPYNGFYCPHHRNYGTQALENYVASIEIGRRAGVPVHLTHCHMSFRYNRERAAELLAAIEHARAAGVEVTMDSYPYLAGSTSLHSFLPSWMHVGGTEACLARLRQPDLRSRLRHEIEVDGSDGISGVPMGWEMVQISGIVGADDSPLVGQFLPEAAARAGRTAFDFFVDLLLDTRLGVTCVIHMGDEQNVQTIARHPAHMVCSDGILVGGRPHPRGWGAHVRFLARYVRELGLLTWEEAVRKMTSAAARRLGFLDRGLIRPGCAADLVVFDPATIEDTATYEQPRSYPNGVHYVVVNGTVAVDAGAPTGATPGRALRTPYARLAERWKTLP